ncbi:MAG: hypothetical protein CVV50_04355, partial [Spirochaetae bacterium HGW-Spirochaetae-6]
FILVFLGIAACFSEVGKSSMNRALDMLTGCWEPQFAALYFSGGLAEEIYYFNGVCVCFERQGRYRVMEDGRVVDHGTFGVEGQILTTRSALFLRPLEKGFTFNQGKISHLSSEKLELDYNLAGQGMGSFSSYRKMKGFLAPK